MAIPSDWNLDKYKSEFESDEHWQLRKTFMLAHKDKFPEDKLVCLARVFSNIEFLGCRYPEKTMKQVAELSKDVADDYREKQKGKLKRTFVQASDAAGAKIKGAGGPPSKTAKLSDSNSTPAGLKYTCFVHEALVKPQLNEGEFPGFIIYESCKTTCPINILTQSAQKSKKWSTINFNFPPEKNSTSDSERCCEIKLNGKVLSYGVGPTNKEAKLKAAIEGLNKLRQTCYTIQEKQSFFTDGELVSKEKVVEDKKTSEPLPEDNVGSRMMMKMGWTGAGLGKAEQGIKAPIEAAQTMHRAGFGHLNTPQFHAKFKNVFKDYIASDSTNDLVFAPDFSSEERKTLHKSTKDIEKGSQKREEEKSEDVEEDLFCFDSDGEVMFLCSSDDEEEDGGGEEAQDCQVCRRLESLTGGENDDDMFDLMWGTGSDKSGLVNITGSDHVLLGRSNDVEEKTDIDRSRQSHQSLIRESKNLKADSRIGSSTSFVRPTGPEPSPMLPSSSTTEDPLLHSRINSVVDNLNRVLNQRAMGQPPWMPLPLPHLNTPTLPLFLKNFTSMKRKKRSRIKTCLCLPNGLRKRVRLCEINSDEDLKAFLISKNALNRSMIVTVTNEDLKQNLGLRKLFPELVSQLEADEDYSEKPPAELDNKRNSDSVMNTAKASTPQLCEAVENEVIETSTAEIDNKRNSDSNTTTAKASTSQMCEAVGSEAIEIIEDSENRGEECTLSNFQINFNESKDDKVTLEAESGSGTVEKCASSSTKETESLIVNDQSSSRSVPSRKRYRAKRLRLHLADGSTVRITVSYLKFNAYFKRHLCREMGVFRGLFEPDKFPPPEYSDSSSDESEVEWVPKSKLFYSEPEDCEMDKVHILRKRWEEFIIKFGSSKRNPFSKRWQKFVDESHPDEKIPLCQKWKDFMTNWDDKEANRIPDSILQPSHELVCLSQSRQKYIQPLHSSKFNSNLVTVYSTDCGKMKICKDLIINNKSWTGRKTNSLSSNTVQTNPGENKISQPNSVDRVSKSDTPKMQEDQDSGKVIEPSEDLSSDICNTQGPVFKIDVNESKDDKMTLEAESESGKVEKCASSSNMESDSTIFDDHSSSRSVPLRKRYRAKRLRLHLADGSTVRIKVSCLTFNAYFKRHLCREMGVFRGLFEPDEFPPPEYSDSSSDESEVEWVPKSKLFNSEPEDCEMDKVHILRKRWEEFIIRFGSSKRNPFAKKWHDFVDESPPDEKIPLCQKWKDFMTKTLKNGKEANRIPDSILQPSHELVSLSQSRQKFIQPLHSSKFNSNLVTVYSTDCGKMKICKDLIINNKSWTGRKTNSLSSDTVQTNRGENKISQPNSLDRVSKSDTPKMQEDQDSGKVIEPSESEIYNNQMPVFEMVTSTSVGTFENEHSEISEKGLESIDDEVISLCEHGSTQLGRTSRTRQPKLRITLQDGSRIRIRTSDLRYNNYYIRNKERYDSIRRGLVNPNEIPPPEYSESSTDEDETDWVTRSRLDITEPMECEIDQSHILRKRWEQYILMVGSSKRNYYGKKWREFLDQSPVGERKTICQKWKEFMVTVNPILGNNIPNSVLQEGHHSKNTLTETTATSHGPLESQGADALNKHIYQPIVTCSTQLDIDQHVQASDLTIVHSSASSSVIRTKKTRPKKVKNPNFITGYLADGGKIKFDHVLTSNRSTPQRK